MLLAIKIVFRLVLAAAAGLMVVIIIWPWFAPNVVTPGFEHALDAGGLQSEEIVWGRWPTEIALLQLKNAELSLRIEGLYLVPAGGPQVRVDHLDLKVSNAPSAHRGPVTRLGDITDALERALWYAPTELQVDTMRICYGEDCATGTMTIDGGNLQLSLDYPRSLTVHAVLSRHRIGIRASLSEPAVDVQIDGVRAADQLLISGTFEGSGMSLNEFAELPVQVNLAAFRGSVEAEIGSGVVAQPVALIDGLRGTLKFSSTHRTRFVREGLEISSTGTVIGSIAADDHGIRLTLTEPIEVSGAGQDMDIKLSAAAPVSCHLARPGATECTAGNLRVHIAGPAGVTADGSMMDTEISVDSLDDLAAHAGKATLSLLLHRNDRVLAEMALPISVENSRVSAYGTDAGRGLGADLQEVAFEHNIPTGRGSLTARVAGQASHIASAIAAWLPPASQMTAGRVSADAHVEWKPDDIGLTLSAEAIDMIGQIGEFVLADANVSISAAGWPETTSEVQLAVDALNVGLPVTDIRTSLRVMADTRAPSFHVLGTSFSASLLGGRVLSEGFHYYPLTGDGNINIRVEAMELAEILSLQPQDILASGTLSGSVPVQLTGGTLRIDDGAMAALDPGGVISYTADAATAASLSSSSEMQTLLAALEDFHYHDLVAGVRYDQAGLMVAQVALKGSNPTFLNGREIHLNLNVEENVATLLKSLRAGEGVSEQLKRSMMRGESQ